MLAKELIQRASEAENQRSLIQGYIDKAYEKALPWRKSKSQGAIMASLMDSTGPRAVFNFAGRLTNRIMPPEARFFELRAGDLITHLDAKEAERIDRSNELGTAILHTVMRASGLDVAMNEMCTDLAVSTGAMFMATGTERHPMRIAAAPAHQLALELGGFGMHEGWHWKRKDVTARVLMREFPNGKFPQEILKAYESNATTEFEVLQSTVWVENEGVYKTYAIVKDEIIDETTQRASPWITPRYWAMPGMAWGVGPLLLALPDILTLNRSVELILQAAELSISKPMMIDDDGVINPEAVEFRPRAIIRTRANPFSQKDPVRPVDMGARIDVGQMVNDELRGNIRQTMLDYNLPPETGAVRSPTEIIKRDQQEQELTGGAFGRLQRELIQPLVARAIDVCDHMSIPGIEWNTLKPDQLLSKVKVISPMARAQEMGDAANFTNFVSVLAQTGGQELVDLMVDMEAQAPWLGDLMGVPARTMRTQEERRQVKDQMAQAALEAQQMQQKQAMMEQMVKAGMPPQNDNQIMPEMNLLGASF